MAEGKKGLLYDLVQKMVTAIQRQVPSITSKQVVLLLAIMMVLSFTFTACAKETQTVQEEIDMTIPLDSTTFKDDGMIPVKYTCDGQNISPPLAWGELPEKTQTCALIVDDPDAPSGAFTHWVLFNIAANTRQLGEGVPTQGQLQNGALQGKNDFGKVGYGGPCPPHGPAHHYRFIIYALDKSLELKAGISKKQLLYAMKGHILAQGQLIGNYQR